MTDLRTGADGLVRCAWPVGDPLYEAYHDHEWGRPATADAVLYEKLVLEGFQAGLSWITVLRKREAFRRHFAGFSPHAVSGFGDREIEGMLGDPGVIRHRKKIESGINNAHRALEMIAEHGSIAAFMWPWAPAPGPAPRDYGDIPAVTEVATALSKELKSRGWTFLGPTTVYAFMQAMGLVNDHLDGCFVRAECADAQAEMRSRYS